MIRQVALLCMVAGAYSQGGYGRPDLSDFDDFDVPAAPGGPGAPPTPGRPGGGPPAGGRPGGFPPGPAPPTGVPPAGVRPGGVPPIGVRPGSLPPGGVPVPGRPVGPGARPGGAAPGGGGGGGGAGGGHSGGVPGEAWPPYNFGYDNTDEFGTRIFHNEQADENNVKTGSYGYMDANGLYRTVTYVADADGYRATIDTNEPGTAPGSSADAVFNANPIEVPAAAGNAITPQRYVSSRPEEAIEADLGKKA